MCNIKIPAGLEFNYRSGNCSDCVYYEARNTNGRGEGWCNWYRCHYSPSQRQGCQSYKCING